MTRKKAYDYSGFSLGRLNEPRFSHLKLLGGWLVYFALYFITENLISEESCHPVHCIVDDMIPFNEVFVIFYIGWYLLVSAALAYTVFYNVLRFRELQLFFIITQLTGVIWYIVWPSIQNLRPDVFPRENIFTAILTLIYAFDTPTCVCPSLHVAFTIGIMSVGLKDEELPKAWKVFLCICTVVISLAVCFVKQHSFLDVIAALPICLLAELVVFGRSYWLPRIKA
ncbi:MAG: hypothetical protein IKF07_08560 [Eubacterium sp.]|nr:hypothetical protein [Eubacterium sp.]